MSPEDYKSTTNRELNSEDLMIRDILDKYLYNWKWFLLFIILALLLTYYKLNFTRNQFKAVGTVKIKDEKSGDNSKLAVFNDLGIMNGSGSNVEDEIEIFKSRALISEVIKSLNLNVSFFTDKNKLSSFLDSNLGFDSNFYETENYINPPLKINFFDSDSLVYLHEGSFVIKVLSESQFQYSYTNELGENTLKKYGFGDKFKTAFGDLIITPAIDFKNEGILGKEIYVTIDRIQELSRYYLRRIEIEPVAEFSSIVQISVTDNVKRKAEDIINELIKKYNQRAIALKEELTETTSDFVTKRLEIISNELSDVDKTAENLKTRYQLSDVASGTGLTMQSGQAVENQIVQANTELQKIDAIKDYVSNKGENDLIPVDVGVNDNGVSSTVQQYNNLMMEKKRLLENSTEKNPVVVNISEQLKILESNINQGLSSIQESQKISLNALTKQDALINSRLYSAPKQERQYRDVTRQQQIKEQLYLYLLQKREETAITLGVADPNAQVIDIGESMKDPVAPKKKVYYLVAIIVGLLIPLIIFYIRDFLDSKIHTRESIERSLNIPILGDVPKLEGKSENYLITKEDNSPVAEAFRILRTNLNFIVDSSNTKGKVIFVTSTIPSEGKSFISSNLAASLAHAGKKTLLIGFDIRAPKLKNYVGLRSSVGITNYIVDKSISFEDLPNSHESIDKLDIISSGDLAPNPSELLMSSRVSQLFNKAREEYDYIVVDTAAFSKVTDTMILSKFADNCLYVIRANYLDKRFLKYINNLYQEKRLPKLNLVINGMDHKKSYGYGYGYGYGSDFDHKKKWYKFF